ncbi:murein hydrolase activator EnvC family protein [Coralloluteibacterium thermophilus]|uniref:Murein hydrolase activator EnvC family protein n=2 Tax=Coralloluteibacterium thermophilum TaxID=2707049 RepID=A0ABV9NJ97_9GAMM
MLLALLAAMPPGLQAQAPARTASQAREEAEAERRLETVRAEIRRLTEAQQRIDAERGAASRSVREADQAVAAAGRALAGTEAEIATQEGELERLEVRRAEREAELRAQRETLAVLVRSAYALGRHEQLKLLLAQDRMSDLARTMAYHRYIQADRTRRIDGLSQQLAELADVARAVEEARTRLTETLARQQRDLEALDRQREERRLAVERLQADLADARSRIAALGRDEKALGELLEKLRDVLADIPAEVEDSRPFARRRGQLPWPVEARASVGFGGRLPDGRTSNGLLLPGAAGTPVRAVAPGRVAFSEWLTGYGLLVILDHGGGWMTLYANNDGLLKESGDWVRTGEPVATVGSSGGQGSAALYFELRQNGRPVDPRPWMASR